MRGLIGRWFPVQAATTAGPMLHRRLINQFCAALAAAMLTAALTASPAFDDTLHAAEGPWS